jgi:hypothetical protein
MLRPALEALHRHRRLVAMLYLAQLAAATIVTLAVGRSLAEVFGQRPIFDRAVAGDVAALVLALEPRADLVYALLAAGVAVALGWAVLSWYLGAGLLGALAGRSFGEIAQTRFWSFARLWLWSLFPWSLAGTAFLVGLGLHAESALERLSWAGWLSSLALHLLPGTLALALVACLVDHARVLLVLAEHPSAGRAFAGAGRLVFSARAPYLRFLAYLGCWLAVSLLYVALTAGRAWAGVGGAIALFLLRQLTLAARFVARVTLSAGQVAYVTERAPPAAP